MATINQALDTETATLVAAEFDHTVENVAFDVESALEVGHEEQAEKKTRTAPSRGHYHGACRSWQNVTPRHDSQDQRDGTGTWWNHATHRRL